MCVKTATGEIGFVENGKVGNLLQTKNQRNDANATINQSTYLYAEANSETPLLVLNKDTRIKLDKRLNPSNEYTKVTIEANDGSIYVGYVKTEHIDSDNLTMFQIVGIILLVINGVVLLLILGFWINNERKNKEK